MRRNILRRTLSEDLDWAECRLQEPTTNAQGKDREPLSSKKGIRTKSYEPTPERKTFAEPCVSDLDDVLSAGDMEDKATGDTPMRKKGQKNKERRSRKERLSLTGSSMPVSSLLNKKDQPKNLKRDDSANSLTSFGQSASKQASIQALNQ